MPHGMCAMQRLSLYDCLGSHQVHQPPRDTVVTLSLGFGRPLHPHPLPTVLCTPIHDIH